MSIGEITIVKAVWDGGPKTKFLTIEGDVMVQSSSADYEINVADRTSLDEKILQLHLDVVNDDGPRKIQPLRFEYRLKMEEDKFEQVQITSGKHSSTAKIKKVQS